MVTCLLNKQVRNKAWRCSTLTWGNPTLPSTLIRFTSEFGMEIRWVQIAMVAKQILYQFARKFKRTLVRPFRVRFACKSNNSESCFKFYYTFNRSYIESIKTPWVLYG